MSLMRAAMLATFAGASLLLAACSSKDEGEKPVAERELTGEELYARWCADCHDPGPGHPGTLRIEARLPADEASLVSRANPAETVRFAVRNGFQMMPPFRMTEISDEELERIVDYLAEPRS